MPSGPLTRFFATLLAGFFGIVMGFRLLDYGIYDPTFLGMGVLLLATSFANALNNKDTWNKMR